MCRAHKIIIQIHDSGCVISSIFNWFTDNHNFSQLTTLTETAHTLTYIQNHQEAESTEPRLVRQRGYGLEQVNHRIRVT